MNKFKKICIGFVVAAGISCLGGAAACAAAPKYFTLDFEERVGLDYILQDKLIDFQSGGKVKEGVEVRFRISTGANVEGAPVISLNGDELTPDANGVYSFVISGNSTVTVGGLQTMHTVTLGRYERKIDPETDEPYNEECWVRYYDLNDKELGETVTVKEGEDFKFKLKASPYYVQSGYSVLAEYTVLDPQSTGDGNIYTLSGVTENVIVSVTGLTQPESFATGKKDAGSGTEADPYKLSEPIDLYYLAVLTNSSYYQSFANAHYILTDDIDMQGEQLFVVGDNSSASAVFTGSFDGRGHTIHNFYITDEVTDQESFQQTYLPYTGMFGAVVATVNAPAVVKNVNLADYEVRVHANPSEEAVAACSGSLVGYSIGAQISNCSATDGDIVVQGNNSQMFYVGGLVGLMQSAYQETSTQTVVFDAYVSSCSTEVYISGTGSPRAAGGIVGYMVSADESAISYVINSYSAGDVSGAMHAGGIAGTMGRFTSVANSYSTADVNARNTMNNSLLASSYKVACAGGIVGFAEEDTVISGCYSANGRLSASSVHGAVFAMTGDIFGGFDDAGETSIDSGAVVNYNNLKRSAGDSNAIFTDTLNWSADVWKLDGEGLPELSGAQEQQTVNIKVLNEDGQTFLQEGFSRKGVASVAAWYSDGDLPEYLTESVGSTVRTWGYYFDGGLTKKVPVGFVPASNVTFYVGFTDYAAVAGRYYLGNETHSNGAYFELDDEGNVFLRNGGLNFSGRYSYDGKNKTVTMYNSALASIGYALTQTDGGLFNFTMKETADGSGNYVIAGRGQLRTGVSADGTAQYTLTPFNFSAVAELPSFAYGEYVDGNGTTFKFNKNLTGTETDASGKVTQFTYTVNGSAVNIKRTTGDYVGVIANNQVQSINGVAVDYKDSIAGAWSRSANSPVIFTFDGRGGVTLAGDGETKTGSYTLTGTRAEISVGEKTYEAAYNTSEGTLNIDGETFYVSDGFTGSWFMTSQKERIEITFEGLNKESGYGFATIAYAGGKVADVDAQYDIMSDSRGTYARLFVGDAQYGELRLGTTIVDDAIVDGNDSDKSGGLFYSLHYDSFYEATCFYLYDNFRGVWVTDADGINTVTFNGRTASGRPEVTFATASGAQSGTYSLENGISGTVTLGSGDNQKIYEVTFDEAANKVGLKLKDAATGNQLARRDDWYLVKLYNGATCYEFDGKGYVNGTVTVTGSDPLNYTVDENGDVTIGGTPLTKAADGSGFMLGGTKLTFNSGFVGEWIVAGEYKSLTIKEVGADFNATVTYEGESGEFKFAYDPTSLTLTHTEIKNGERIVTQLNLLGTSELSIRQNSLAGNLFVNCAKPEVLDNFKGTFTNADGSKWEFDGFGGCFYASGNATFTSASGASESYSYNINELGVPKIEKDAGIVFNETDKGYTGNGGQTYYDAFECDALYERVVRRSEGGTSVEYMFDGVDGLWRITDGGYERAFTYEIIDADKVELVDAENKKYIGEIKNENVYYSLTVTVKTEETQPDENNG